MSTLPTYRSKITKGLALVATLNLGAMLLVLLFVRSTLAVSLAEEYLQSLGRFIDADVRYVLLVQDPGTTEAYVEGLARFPWVRSVRLLDRDGQRLGAAGESEWRAPLESYSPEGAVRLIGDEAHLTRTIELRDEDDGSRLGALLHLSIENDAFVDMIQRTIYFLIAVVVGVTLVMFLMSRHLAGSATRAIADLSANLESVDPERGSLVPANLHTDTRELDTVQRSFNALVRRIDQHNEELERRIEARTRDLASALREKEAIEATRSSLIMNLSHDLKTPLTAGLGYLDHALEELRSPAPDLAVLAYTVEHARAHGVTLGEEVSTLLQYSISADELSGVSRHAVDVRALLASAIEGVEHMRQRGRNTIELDYRGRRQLITVERLVRHVVDNLLSNANRYCVEGRITVRCQVADRLDLSVEDSGPGIPLDEQERIFEPHFRSAVNDAIGPKGMGIGLSLTKTWVDQLGGSITLDSRPGRTVFRVLIPSTEER